MHGLSVFLNDKSAGRREPYAPGDYETYSPIKRRRLHGCGWASSNLLDYNKIDCAAPLARIKEWDRYTVVSPDCAVTLSIADLGNLGYIFASLTDFTQKPCRTFSQTITRATPEDA